MSQLSALAGGYSRPVRSANSHCQLLSLHALASSVSKECRRHLKVLVVRFTHMLVFCIAAGDNDDQLYPSLAEDCTTQILTWSLVSLSYNRYCPASLTTYMLHRRECLHLTRQGSKLNELCCGRDGRASGSSVQRRVSGSSLLSVAARG